MNNLVLDRNGRRFGTLLSWDPMRLFDDLMTRQPPPTERQRSNDGVRIR